MISISRREFLQTVGVAAASTLLASCKQPVKISTESQDERKQEMMTNTKFRLFVGTYTTSFQNEPTQSKGIYLYELDPATVKLTQVACAVETEQPSFLAVHPNLNVLYAANEMMAFQGKPGGAISSFKINQETGLLSFMNQKPTLGGAPCYVAVDQMGRYAMVANYMGGNAIMYPLLADGSLGDYSDFVQYQGKGANPKRQEGPHTHSVTIDPTNQYAFVADLGIDKIMIYRLGTGQFLANDPAWIDVAPGSGPRHMDFHPSGKYAYLINEMGNSITAFNYDSAKGNLIEFQTVPTLPQDFQGENTTADLHISPSGKFIYGSNRGHDSLVIYAIDESGRLTYVDHESTQGKTPRNFAIDPSGRLLLVANQDSNNIVSFRIDEATGKLAPSGEITQAPMPVCIRFF
jgi:6-phosphogluconolactonase